MLLNYIGGAQDPGIKVKCGSGILGLDKTTAVSLCERANVFLVVYVCVFVVIPTTENIRGVSRFDAQSCLRILSNHYKGCNAPS